MYRDVVVFAGSRREVALLMMSPEGVRYGDLIAWLPAGGWPGRLAQALVVATHLDDQPQADQPHPLATTLHDLGIRT